jgi:hypothetical protein
VASWRVIYLEIFRWQHMTKGLRFNPPPPLRGADRLPTAGWPLRLASLSAVAAPVLFVTTVLMERRQALRQ